MAFWSKTLDKGIPMCYSEYEKGVNLMPTKGTGTVIARVKDEIILEIKRKAHRRGLTVNAWLNWVINIGLRSHSRK